MHIALRAEPAHGRDGSVAHHPGVGPTPTRPCRPSRAAGRRPSTPGARGPRLATRRRSGRPAGAQARALEPRREVAQPVAACGPWCVRFQGQRDSQPQAPLLKFQPIQSRAVRHTCGVGRMQARARRPGQRCAPEAVGGDGGLTSLTPSSANPTTANANDAMISTARTARYMSRRRWR